MAAAWKFLRAEEPRKSEKALDSLYALGSRIRTTRAQSDLNELEREIDRLLQDQRAKATAGDENALDVTTLNEAAHRLRSLIHDRRTLLTTQPGDKVQA